MMTRVGRAVSALAPCLSTASARKEYVPGVDVFHVRRYGAVVSLPISVAPL
jgi:hypothetical protein